MQHLLKITILLLFLTGLASSDGLTRHQESLETVGGSWVSSSGAKVYLGATTRPGGITISINGGAVIQGNLVTENDGSIYFTYSSTDGTPMRGDYNPDGYVINVRSTSSSFSSVWSRS